MPPPPSIHHKQQTLESAVGKALAASEMGVLVRAAGACFKSSHKFFLEETEKVRRKPAHGVRAGSGGQRPSLNPLSIVDVTVTVRCLGSEECTVAMLIDKTG